MVLCDSYKLGLGKPSLPRMMRGVFVGRISAVCARPRDLRSRLGRGRRPAPNPGALSRYQRNAQVRRGSPTPPDRPTEGLQFGDRPSRDTPEDLRSHLGRGRSRYRYRFCRLSGRNGSERCKPLRKPGCHSGANTINPGTGVLKRHSHL
jgi:hypothetical protein